MGRENYQIWNAEMCATEVDVQDKKIKCSCNLMRTDQITVLTDLSRTLGPQLFVLEEEISINKNIEIN